VQFLHVSYNELLGGGLAIELIRLAFAQGEPLRALTAADGLVSIGLLSSGVLRPPALEENVNVPLGARLDSGA
jgi:hypothetical protein